MKKGNLLFFDCYGGDKLCMFVFEIYKFKQPLSRSLVFDKDRLSFMLFKKETLREHRTYKNGERIDE